MRYAALIPARGGSERIPRKNLALVGGLSLVARAVYAAFDAGIADVTVGTDDMHIMQEAEDCGAKCWQRPASLSTGKPGADGTSSTELVMRRWFSVRRGEFDAIVLLQPTSPLRTGDHVREAMRLLESSGADSVASVVRNPRAAFAGRAYPREGFTQLRPFRPAGHRPRTQDARPIIEENGAIYVTRAAMFEATGDRMGGTVAAYVMDEDSSIDIDEPEDLERARDAWARRERKGAA